MSTWQSELSALSETSAIFDSISQKSQTEFLFKLESAHIDEKIQFAVWEAFGSYLRRQLKQGRSIQIPRFGKFTFTFHTANPNHTVDDFTKLKDIRRPIFILSKDFLSGKDIKAGVFTEAGMTPYPSLSQTGRVQEAILNLVEIACESGTTKDIVKLCLQRVFREILILVKKNQPVKMDIPSLGTLHIKSGICAVKFYDSIAEDLKIPAIRESGRGRNLVPLSPSVQTKPYLASVFRTETADPNNKPIYVDEAASQYLKKELNIEVASLRKATSQSALKRSMFTADNFHNKEEGWVTAKSTTMYASPTIFQSFDSATYIKRIQLWVKNQRISATEAFYVLMTEIYGIEESGNARLAFEDFAKVLKKLDFKLQPINAKKLFNILDKNKDGYVDINDWNAMIAGDEAPAKILNDLLKTRGLKINKLLEAMNIKKESSFVDKKKLCEGLAVLGPNMPKENISDMVERLLDGKDFIDVDKLIDMVENQQESEKQDYSSWKELIDRVKNFLDQNQNTKKQVLFQQIKEASQGKDTLFARDFKFYLSKLAMGLTTTEINKISRRYEVAAGKLVEFKRFYKDVENADDSLNNEICLRNIAVKLQEYIKSKKWEIQLFLRKVSALSDMNASMEHTRSTETSFHKGISNKVPISLFGFFLKNNILEQGSPMESDQVADRIDIDRDGYVSKEDLETFIVRSGLYSKTKLLSSELASPKNLRLFPTEPLSEQDVQSLLRELRIILDSQRVTNHELFTKLDVNEDGFLTIDEFCTGLEKIIPLPRLITEGFFAYIDKQKVGFLDLESFLKVLKKSVNVKDKPVIRDNFDWPTEVIKKIRKYFEAGGVSKDDAFRIVDTDFDGNISRTDLKHFLTKFMNFSTEDATETRLDRLFKLLDRFKRGCIQLDDFIRIFDDHNQFFPQQTGTMRASIHSAAAHTRHSSPSSPIEVPEEQNVAFDWMVNAKQQIGLVMSQRFESLRAGFDIICGHTGKILYKTFKDWIETNNVLQGFNLTANLLLLLYAHIDPHKKGYLTFNDWELAFKTFDWNHQLLAEFKNLLYTSFSGLEAAFAHFYLRSGKTKKHGYDSNAEFGYLDFVEGLKALLPTRFSQGEIDYIWNKLCNGKWKMTFAMFSHAMESNKFMAKETSQSANGFGASSPSNHFATNRSASSFPRTTLLHKDFYTGRPIPYRGAASTEIFEKLKKNIRSEKSSLIEQFKAIDTAKLGRISSVEFRNVLMKLKIGLSNAEVSYLLDLVSIDKDGLIDWKAFVDKILLKESDVQLFQRFKDKLTKIKQGIYTYLLTPKDAFAKYNINGTGKLVYEEFVELVGDIYKASNEEVPSVSILRDLFDFIDIKKDGVIDINEWSQTFGQLSILYGKEPVDPRKQAVTLTKALLESHDVDWVNTKNYDDVMIAIGRNRKLLYNRFLNLEQRRVVITFEKTREVIKEILEYSGVKVDEKNWGVLIRFAEVRGVVDFRKLLSVFKDRLHKITTIPRMKTIYI